MRGHICSRARRRRISAASLLVAAALIGTVISSRTATAQPSCPLGLARVRSLQWSSISSLGIVETGFELFGYVGAVDGASRWRSSVRSEDGRALRSAEYVCRGGQLVLIAFADQQGDATVVLEPGIPILADPPGSFHTVVIGTALIETGSRSEVISALYRADVLSHPPQIVETIAGEVTASATRVEISVISRRKNTEFEAELTSWWLAGADRYPVRIHIDQWIPRRHALTLELASSWVPRLSLVPAVTSP